MIKENQIAIDRLAEKPIGYDSNEQTKWTVDSIQERALKLGKDFNPNPEIANRLKKDLANGALVIFTKKEVTKATENGLIKPEWVEEISSLVEGQNDIAVITKSNLPNNINNLDQQLIEFFLNQNNC